MHAQDASQHCVSMLSCVNYCFYAFDLSSPKDTIIYDHVHCIFLSSTRELNAKESSSQNRKAYSDKDD